MNFLEEYAAEREAALVQELAVANVMADYYQEAYSDSARALLRAEDIGWNKLGISGDLKQITLAEAKDVADRLQGYCESNPLLARGKEIRNSYLFSSEYEVGTARAETTITPQQRNIINTQKNQDNVFSLEALGVIEGERYGTGQVFVLYDRTKKEFQLIPFAQIADIIYNPHDASEIWYVKREWSATIVNKNGDKEQKTWKEWYPASRYENPEGGYAKSIGGVQVVTSKRMVTDRVNVRPGSNLGIPDSFAAAPWALAYSAYLSDGTKVLAALAEWAWVVRPKKQDPAQRAAASVRTERGAGGTLLTDMDVQAMPKGNAVDLNTGRPLAAQVAAALGISIVVLLADPGQSGAYGTAQTLSDPNRRTMEARREHNTKFLLECLRLIGIKDPAVVWEKMAPGTDKEEMELLGMAWGTGLFDPAEIRPRAADLAHVTLLGEDAPEGVMIPNNSNSLQTQTDITTPEVAPDGSNAMANGQGRDSVGVGNKSKTKTAASAAKPAATSKTTATK